MYEVRNAVVESFGIEEIKQNRQKKKTPENRCKKKGDQNMQNMMVFILLFVMRILLYSQELHISIFSYINLSSKLIELSSQ